MERVDQKIADITGALSTLEALWQDEHATKVIALIQAFPFAGHDEVAAVPTALIGRMFDEGFNDSLRRSSSSVSPRTSSRTASARSSAQARSGRSRSKPTARRISKRLKTWSCRRR